MSEPPKVFISYSHDSHEHMERVLQLSNRLRDDGIDCEIDRYEQSPPEGWPRWTRNQIESADFVLIVCTEIYDRRFSGKEKVGTGLGAQWEGAILTQNLYDQEPNNRKLVPVLFSSQDLSHIPVELRGASHYVINTEQGYDDLSRHITKQPSVEKPALGTFKQRPPRPSKQDFVPIKKLTAEDEPIQTTAFGENPGNLPLPRSVHVIGWKGVEEEDLYANTGVLPPACLVGMGNLDDLPRLTFRRKSFDLLIADIEYLARYDQELRRLQSLGGSEMVEKYWARLAPLLKGPQVRNALTHKSGQFGMPVQFGFTEILINTKLLPDLAKQDDQQITYRSLNIIDMLEECKRKQAKFKIGFWDIYLPTLTHVLATTCPEITQLVEQAKMKSPGVQATSPLLDKLYRITEKTVSAITNKISQYRGYVEFLDNSYRVTDQLVEGDVAIVYGGGSSLLVPNYDFKDKIRALLPQNFTFVWVNCCAALENAAFDDSFLSLIDYWFQKSSQQKLSSYGGYRGCPAVNDALAEIRKNTEHPAYCTVNKVLGEDNRVNPEYTLSLRTLPSQWRGWQKSWENMKRSLKT